MPGATESEKPRRVRRPRAKTVSHPIDGDFRRDVVFNAEGKPVTAKNSAFDLLYLTPEDASIWREWGAVKAQRTDGYRVPFDETGEGDYKQGGLTLYKVPRNVKKQREKHAQDQVAEQMKAIKKEARTSAGGEFVETFETV